MDAEFVALHRFDFDTGDLWAAYSADVIPAGRVRRPFKHNSALWVTVGFSCNGLYAEGWQLAPEDPAAPGVAYAVRVAEDPRPYDAFYERVRVTWRGTAYILTGERIFLPD